MATQTLSAVPDSLPAEPYEGFDCGGQVQLCQALRLPEVRERLGLSALSFDQLAWAPRLGDRPLTATAVEHVRERFAFFAASHGQPKWRATAEEVRAAISLVAAERLVHPVAQRLEGLRWDAEARLARVAAEVLGVDPKAAPHAAEVVRKWFIATAARAFRPGCPVDGVLTLVGDDVPPPALFFRLLVPPDEFADAPVPLDSPEMAATLRSAWVCAQNDLPLRAVKDPGGVASFLSRPMDAVRSFAEPDGERAARTTVFVATVPAMPPLEDDALRRRFHAVPVRRLDAAKLEAWAPMLWAEAAAEFITGSSWRLTPAEEAQGAEFHRRTAAGDPWEAPLIDYMTRMLNRNDDIKSAPSMAMILSAVFDMKGPKVDVGAAMRAGRLLRRHGYRSRPIRLGAGRTHVWYPDWLEDDGNDDLEPCQPCQP
jgi:predicted P-loop ATPase